MDGRASAACGHSPTLADIFGTVLAGRAGPMPPHHWRVLRTIVQCRTAALGGHHYRCEDCGAGHCVPHSCRNRHCPACQGANGADWMNRQCESLLPVPYFHVVFTLPHALNPLVAQNQAVIYGRNPVGLPVPAALAKLPEAEKLNRLLQELAWDAVTQHPLSGIQAPAAAR